MPGASTRYRRGFWGGNEMDSQRLILLFALGLIFILISQAWEAEQAKVPSVAPPEPSQVQREVPPAPEVKPPSSIPAPSAAVTSNALESAERIHVTTDLVRAEIDTYGGDLRALYLLEHPVSVDQPDTPLQLLTDTGTEVFVAQSGLIGHDRTYPTHRTQYTAERREYRLTEGDAELRVPMHWRAPDGVSYSKTYVFHRGGYVVGVEYTIVNPTPTEWTGFLYARLQHSYVETGGLFRLPTYTGAAIYTPEDKYEKISFSDMAAKPLTRDVQGGWVAMLRHYFVGAWLPPATERERFYSDQVESNRYVIGFNNLEPTRVAPGDKGRLVANLYVGPKEQKRLKQLSEGMELTVDYGWLTFLSAPLFWLLEFIHRWVGNWGWAIVFLTIIIKLVFYPLSAASYKSMANMKKLQPKLKDLKERFGDDKQKLNQAMMEMYKTEKINPLGGCLPILIQIPVFIALYWVLLESIEMRQAPFTLWLRDLSIPDPYFVLPIIMGATMYLQQVLNPAPIDPIQKKIFMALPVMFTVFFLFFPSGLVLYWVVNNALSIAQQWHIMRNVGARRK